MLADIACVHRQVTDVALAWNWYYQQSTLAISGPPIDQQGPFTWTGNYSVWPHIGLPTVYNFSWVHMKPAYKPWT